MVWRLGLGFLTLRRFLLAAKAAAAGGVAWELALAIHPHSRPYFAPIAAVLVVQPTVYDSISRALQRVVGVVMGVAVAVAVSRFLTPSISSIVLIIFVGLLLGWIIRLSPQGVVQVPVSAFLVFVVGHATPGYGGSRVVDTLIGAGVGVIAVLLSPYAPRPELVLSDALVPLRRCSDVLRVIGTGIGSAWTGEQAAVWRDDSFELTAAIEKGRVDYEAHEQTVRWNTWARREGAVLERADAALRTGERIAGPTRSIALALVDGAAEARPMPALGALLAMTASTTATYAEWLAAEESPTERRLLSETMRAADDTLGRTVDKVKQRSDNDTTQWITFATILAMSQRIVAEVCRPVDSMESEKA
jgi:hypothetical protein